MCCVVKPMPYEIVLGQACDGRAGGEEVSDLTTKWTLCEGPHDGVI